MLTPKCDLSQLDLRTPKVKKGRREERQEVREWARKNPKWAEAGQNARVRKPRRGGQNLVCFQSLYALKGILG